MLNPLKLLAPALIPSWNFFDVIAASPRIEYALTKTPDEPPRDWREVRPRPATVSLKAMLGRLVWNPRWNETLFLVSCAERLMDQPTAHSEDEIFQRIAADLARERDATTAQSWLRFRLVLLSRQGETIGRETAYIAAPRQVADISVR